MIFFPFMVYPQEVVIGTGTSTGRFPLSSYYGYERSASLYTSSEVNQIGGVLTLGWYATTARSTNRPVKIYLKEVTASTLTAQNWATLITGATLVYNGSVPVINEWNTFNLAVPFNYTGGTNNLLVLVETNYGGGGTDGSSGAAIRYTSSTSKHLTHADDYSMPTSNLTVSSDRPNLKINFGPLITCFATASVNVSGTTAQGTVLTWSAATPNPANGYEYEVRTDQNPGTPGAIATGIVGAGVLTTNVSNLTANTTYNVFVRSLCSESDVSNWSIVKSFTTLCNPVTTLPYLENFDSVAVGGFPTCWSRPIVYNGYPSAVTANAVSSPHSLRFQSTPAAPTYAISPAFSQNIETLRVKFKLKREGTSSGVIHVGVMTDVSNTSTFELIQVITPANDNMNDYVVNLNTSTITGPNKYVAFKHVSNVNNYYYWLDDFLVEYIPACNDLTGVGVTNVTKNTARIFWNDIAPAISNGFTYEIRIDGEPGTAGAIQSGIVEANVNFKDIEGLSPSTEYKVYVRSACSTTEFGVWSAPVTFTTLCDYPDLVSPVIPGSVCGQGTVELSAEFTSGTVNWFASQTGGTPIGTGNNFITPEINTTTSYWVSGESNQFSIGVGGKLLPQSSPTTSSSNNYGIVFNVLDGINLVSTDIYSTSVGTMGVKIINPAGQEILNISNISISNTGASNPNVINLNNIYLEPGNGYKILLHSYSGVNLIRDNIGVSFPYLDDDNILNVTSSEWGGTTTSYYYYFYNLQYQSACKSPRTEVIATVTPAPEVVLSATEVQICEGQSETVTITSGASNYDSYTISPSTGVTGDATIGWTFNPTVSTSYTLTAAQLSGQECAKEISIDVNVNNIPTVIANNDTVVACVGEVVPMSVSVSGLSTTVNFGTESLVADATTATHPNPLSGWYGGHKVQMIYLASELTAKGMVAGSKISSIAFDIASNNSNSACNDFRIKIGTTTASVATTTFQNSSNLQTVYNQTYIPSQTGWVTFEFTTPFIWDGVSNIIIETAHNSGNNGNGSGTNIRYSNIPFVGVVCGFKDSVTPAGVASLDATIFSTINAVNRRPNIILGTNEITNNVWNPVDNLYTNAAATIPYVAGTSTSTVYFKANASIPSQDYTITVTSENLCSSTEMINVSINQTPTLVVTETDYCFGNTLATIEDTLTAIGTISWYTASTGGTLLPNTTPLVNGQTYYVEQIVNGCPSSIRGSVTVNVQQTAAPTLVNPSITFCTIEGMTLADVVVNGTNVKWYNAATLGTELPLTTALVLGNSYYASQTINECESLTRLVFVPSLTQVELPTTSNPSQLFCSQNTNLISDIEILGQGIKWYDAATNGNELSEDTVLESGVYYASQSIDGCESTLRLAITITVSEIPAPTAVDQSFCIFEEKTVNDLVASGNELKWYSSENSLIALLDTDILVTGSYFVSQTVSGCESTERTEIIVTIQNTPAPIVVNQSFCIVEGKTIGDLVVNGTSIKWYDSLTSNTVLDDTDVLASGTYFATQTLNGCESLNRVEVQVTIQDTPAPTSENQTYCALENKTIGDLLVNGTNVKWYASTTSVTELASTDILTSGSYFATQTSNGCESINRVEVQVTIQDTQAPTAQNQTFCAAEQKTLADVVINGSNIKWYASSSSTTELASSTVLTSGTYYASQTVNGCESVQRKAVVITVTLPVNLTSQSISSCSQTVLQNVIIDGLSFNQLKWYSSMTSTNSLPGTMVVNSTMVLFVSSVNGTCASPRVAISFEVLPSIPQPTAASTQYICGSGTVADLVAGGISDGTLEWFNSIGNTIPLSSSTPLVNGTYYVSQRIGNCTSTRKAVAVMILNTTAPIYNSLQVCQGTTINQVDWFIPSGAVYEWYTTPTSQTVLPPNTVLESGTYYVGRNHFGCKSARSMVQVTVFGTPVAPSGESIQSIAAPATIDSIQMNEENIIWYATYNHAIQHVNALSQTTSLEDGFTYYGVIQSENGCYSLPTAVTVNLYLGMDDLDKSMLKVYPNPTSDLVTIAYNETIDVVEVYSLLGQQLLRIQPKAYETQVDLEKFTSGTYIIKISSGNNNSFIKVVRK